MDANLANADPDAAKSALRGLREAIADGDEARIRAALALVLASQHLANLERLEPELAHHAAELAGDRGRSGDPSDATREATRSR